MSATQLRQGLGSGIEREDLVLADDLEDLNSQLLRSFFERTSAWRDRLPMHAAHHRQLIERVLCPQFRLVPGLEAPHHKAASQLIRLSARTPSLTA